MPEADAYRGLRMNEPVDREQKNRILVVDDGPADLQFLMKILQGDGYKVSPTTDGELALRSIQSAVPDLILLDIQMPGLDGYQICERLKASESTRDIPIIF